MITIINLDHWSEFDGAIKSIKDECEELKNKGFGLVSPIVFRGQSDHHWPLRTTLERAVSNKITVFEYYLLINKINPEIESFTGSKWDLPEYNTIYNWCHEYVNKHGAPLAYEYLVYLRHHGFPSPLLDWTRSPYVAAHFAFSGSDSDRVAVFAFVEFAGEAKSGTSGQPSINGLGPYVRTHTRHFLQRSEYTVCWCFEEGEWIFAPHQSVSELNNRSQDIFWKITLPIESQTEALRSLDAHNLNDFSLFQGEEALLKTLWNREHILGGH